MYVMKLASPTAFLVHRLVTSHWRSVFHQVRLIAFVLYGMRLCLIYFKLPRNVCIFLEVNFYLLILCVVLSYIFYTGVSNVLWTKEIHWKWDLFQSQLITNIENELCDCGVLQNPYVCHTSGLDLPLSHTDVCDFLWMSLTWTFANYFRTWNINIVSRIMADMNISLC